MKKTSLLSSFAISAIALAALSGCAVTDFFQHEASADFESTKALDAGWDKSAPWVPADATDIRTRSSTTGDSAILRATTATALDPELCVEIERKSGPVYEQDWSGDAYVDNAWACDNWTVVATDDGWYGWTPNYPEEQEQSPAR